MIKNLKVKVFIMFLVCIIFRAADLYAVNVSSFTGLESAINSSQTSITFTTANIAYSSGLPDINYSPVNFYGDVTLDGNNSYALFKFNNSDITFHNNISFINGAASADGGAIYIGDDSKISFSGSNIDFTGNVSKKSGGAIYLGMGVDAIFKDSNINFASNTAANYGGALFGDSGSNITVENSTAVFSGNGARDGAALVSYAGVNTVFKNSNINFTNNSATGNGGALYAYSASKITVENSGGIFTGNNAKNGGAAYLSAYSNAVFKNSGINFTSNSATENGGAGYVYSDSNITVENSTAVFSDNGAKSGGAVYVNIYSSAVFKNSDINFTSNTAEDYGGAISVDDNSNITAENSNVVFFGNKANLGGAVYLANNSTAAFKGSNVNFTSNTADGTGAGGVLRADNSNISVENSTAVFAGNGAYYGGAVFLQINSTAVFSGSNINFKNNTAIIGGAVYLDESETVFTGSNVEFTSNTATFAGGAITLNSGSSAVFKDSNINFTANTTSGNGGALSAYGGANIKINVENSTAVFSGNSANIYGGAVYLTNSSTAAFKDSNIKFTSNKSNSGGALSASASNINIENSTAEFFGNYAASGNGGAIFLSMGSKAAFTGSNINFTSNSASSMGGAVYLYTGSIAELEHSNINFTSNSANYGGAIYATGSNIAVKASTAVFSGNSNGAGSGGAISLTYNSTAAFTDSNINFTSNKSAAGGAVYLYSGSIAAFEHSNINFTGNTADSGGAIYAYDSNAAVKASTAQFSGNSAGSGGAIYLYNSGIDFGNSEIIAAGNVAASSGGFIYSQGYTNVNINLDTVHLESNTAAVGGTFYGQSGTTFTFTAANSDISNASASYAGGYIALGENGTGDFRNTVLKAQGNRSGNGGFMYVAGGNALFGKAGLENNEAEKGGAIAVLNGGTIEFSGEEGIFRGNRASEYGGAIYARGEGAGGKALLSVSSGNIIFEGNKANGDGNDIYADGNIEFELRTAENSKISMDGGIRGTQDSAIIKTGLGKLVLLDNSVNEYYGEFRIEQGIVEAGKNTTLKFGKLNIEDGGIYSLINNATQTTEAGEANIKGSMKIDVDLDNLSADILKVTKGINPNSSGNVDLSQAGKLVLNLYGAAGLGKSEITIIEADNKITGAFTGDPFEEWGYIREVGKENPGIVYEDNRAYIRMLQGSNFEKGIMNLTHNQREVARSADRIMAGMANGAAIRSEFLSTINKLDKMGSEIEKKRGLDELAGSMIANMLSAGAYGYGNEELFERIKPRINGGQNNEISKSIWGQGYAYGQDRDKDENSVEDFSINGYGIEAGADLLTGENSVSGLYAGYERSKGKQGESKGDVEAIGAGVYGGWFGKNLDIKARVYGGKLQYNINRELKLLGEKAESEIEAYNVKGDILAQYNIWLTDNLSIAPYGHVKGGYVINSSARDKGRGGANIEIYDGNYGRVEGNLGLGINYAIGRLSLYGKISGGYLVLGDRAEYRGEFIDTGEEMEIWGTTSEKISAQAAIGAEYEITKSWSIYANMSGSYYENSRGYYGNIGVNYSFKMGKNEEIYAIEIVPEEEITEEKVEEAKKRRDDPTIKKYRLDVTTFKLNEYLLTQEAKETIRKNAEEIKKYDYTLITVEGHTDTTGTDEINGRLSRLRAESVYKELIMNGIPADKMNFLGYGSRLPTATNATREGRAANRRTEIYVE